MREKELRNLGKLKEVTLGLRVFDEICSW